MPLTVGDRLGHYDVTALIGEGGMGQVYQATDTKLKRQVALKILPEAFATDPDRLARFQREAQVLASLNHPNIAQIHGIEEDEGTRALVLELVEGPTLADRISKGPIPLDEALPIAKQIAEALEAAHEAGVIHRDLKPANIKVREDGTVKVLDFGLAKALDPNPEGDPSQSPTLTAAATQMGVIMGTAAYMSPEQAKGKSVDKRADIWSFGVVLFEMLTGQHLFSGETVSETLAAVMMKEPVWETLAGELPARLSNVLRRCLEKDPHLRMRDIGDVRLAMGGAFETIAEPRSEPAAPTVRRLWQQPVPVAVAASVAVGLAVWALRPVPPALDQPTSRVSISVPPSRPIAATPLLSDVAISGDGRRIVYQASIAGDLDVRTLDELSAVPLRGAEGAANPFVSADGEWVGFYANQSLQRVLIGGGPTVTICEVAGQIRGASWGPNDVIVFGLSEPGGLWQVPAAGGTPTPLSDVDASTISHAFPDVLPSGAGVLYTETRVASDSRISVLDLATGEHRIIIENGSSPRYSTSGHIVYAFEDTLRAVPFDQELLQVTGDPVPVVEGVANKGLSGAGNFDLSDTGDLVYVRGTADGFAARQFVWVDEDGREELLPLPPRNYLSPRVSPDGRWIAVVVSDEGRDLWVYDAVSAAGQRLSRGFAAFTPVWTPDGNRIVFASAHEGPMNIYSVLRDGSQEPALRLADEGGDYPTSVSPDGRTVAFTRNIGGIATQHREIWEVAVDGDEPPGPLLQGTFLRGNGEYSPDGTWFVYQSNQSGRPEVYVQPYPGPGAVVPASIGGGDQVMWSADGSRLFYRLDNQMMAVTVDPGDPLRIGTPAALFETADFITPGGIRQYHLAPDGRFLMLKDAALNGDVGQAPNQVVLVQNWFEELTRLVPTEEP